jgi:hypothetical protein
MDMTTATLINSWNKKMIGAYEPERDTPTHYGFVRHGNPDGTFGKPFRGWVSKRSAVIRLPRCV